VITEPFAQVFHERRLAYSVGAGNPQPHALSASSRPGSLPTRRPQHARPEQATARQSVPDLVIGPMPTVGGLGPAVTAPRLVWLRAWWASQLMRSVGSASAAA
jgi:hypothetical protein